MGRNPIPDEIKKARGTYRYDRANSAQPKFTQLIAAEPPSELAEGAKGFWNQIVPELLDAKILQEPDMLMLISLCNETALYFSLCEDIDSLQTKTYKTDNGTVKERPEFKMRREALKMIVTLSSKFGLSPADRQKLIAPPREKKKSALTQAMEGD